MLLAALAAFALIRGNSGTSSSSDPDDRAQVARGSAVYAEACASCHGARLEGQADWRSPNPDGTYPAPPHDAGGHTWHHPDGLLLRYIRLGGAEALTGIPGVRSAMPGFSDTLADQDIRNVLAFIKAQWPDEMRAYQRAATENEG
ncbi:MAG: cytochrome c [Thermohalobaculum sp.]|nr:cytochrome c [Thermohalobaculum sp.]